MSNKLLNLVRDARLGDPTMKEVLKVIADQSNDAGTGVWSSYAYIAWCIERERSTVIKKCAVLVEMGLLGRIRRQGITNLWSISIVSLERLAEPWRHAIEVFDDEPVGLGDQGVVSGDQPVVSGDPSPKEPKNKNSVSGEEQKTEEPVYVDDGQDGVPYEWQIELDNFLTGWKTCFPNKAQPRRSGMIRKWRTRFNDEGFRANWRRALWATKDTVWAHKEGWFKWQWFLHNDENYEKLLDGTFDFKASQKAQQVTQPARKVEADISVDDWANRRTK